MFRRQETRWVWIVSLLGVTALACGLLYEVRSYRNSALATSRNFYGTLRIVDETISNSGPARVLLNGAITHGVQFLSGPHKRLPISYYDHQSGVGYAILRHPLRLAEPTSDGAAPAGIKIGVIGLGAGAIAAYGRSKDVVRFYEINPEVERMAREYFTYLDDSPARVEVAIGDARLVLEAELDSTGPQKFDVLALDAFSSDAIPMHLLTRECNELYWRHLKPDGILAVHISNRNIDLAPVVHALAKQVRKQAIILRSDAEDSTGKNVGAYDAAWIVVTSNQDFLHDSEVRRRIRNKGIVLTEEDATLLWTDDYGSLWQVLRVD
jgi:SAM-dependent methyltransferase